jgi:hypothetical protein
VLSYRWRSARALDVLGVLVGRSGDLVSEDEILAAVWPATVVEDKNVNTRGGENSLPVSIAIPLARYVARRMRGNRSKFY